MSNMLQAIKLHLRRSITQAQLDYYGVLGLELFCDQREQISSALKQAADTWKSSDTKSNPDSAQQVAKILRQAQSILLDPTKKKSYDIQLAKLRGMELVASAPLSSSTTASTIDDSFRPYLPQGDPWAAFEASLHESTSSALDFEADELEDRRSRLRQLFPELVAVHEHSFVANDDSEMVEGTSVGIVSELFGEDDNGESERHEGREEVSSQISQITKRRRQKQWMTIAAILAISMSLLIYSTIIFFKNQSQLTQSDKAKKQSNDQRLAIENSITGETNSNSASSNGESNDDQSKSLNVSRDKPTKRNSVRSDLPGVQRSNGTEQTDASLNMSAPTEPMQTTPPSIESQPAMPSQSSISSTAETPATSETPKPEMNTMTPEIKPANNATPASEMVVDKKAWTASMKKAREAIDKVDFKTFEKQIEEALQLAKTEEMEAKTRRLDQLGQLYKMFIDSMAQAKNKLRSNETLTVGATKVNIVEATKDKLVIRSKGNNETHSWEKLPPGIAMALADLTLNDSAPVDIAARAVYFSLSPSTNDIMRKRAKGWFEKSIGKGDVRADLLQALTDTYE